MVIKSPMAQYTIAQGDYARLENLGKSKNVKRLKKAVSLVKKGRKSGKF